MKTVKILLYSTKALPHLAHFGHGTGEYRCFGNDIKSQNLVFKKEGFNPNDISNYLNGKIIAECDCNLVEGINCCCVKYNKNDQIGYGNFLDNGVYKVKWKKDINLVDKNPSNNNPKNYKNDGVIFERKDCYIDTMLKNDDLSKICLTPQELLDYVKLGNEFYMIHLDNVKAFDKPKELKEYQTSYYCSLKHEVKETMLGDIKTICNNRFCKYYNHEFDDCDKMSEPIKSVKNMMYCYDKHFNDRILIPVSSQEACNILNGKQTILVRNYILNMLKELIRNGYRR